MLLDHEFVSGGRGRALFSIALSDLYRKKTIFPKTKTYSGVGGYREVMEEIKVMSIDKIIHLIEKIM